ncbi:MAG: hypothetical protein HFJ60_04660 [Clostridia bacterium]|nr:hypothetical protein [Clostridia bacterium]
MSKTTTKINRIKKKLDKISGLEDKTILMYINKIDIFVDIVTTEINLYLKENPFNGSIL